MPPEEMGAVICFSLFIEPDRVSAGPYTIHGDGRGFSSDSDPAASRGYVWISVDDGKVVSHLNQTGYIETIVGQDPTMHPDWAGPIAVGETIRWTGPSSQNEWTVTRGENGEFTVSYDLVLAGDLENVAPHINGTITFRPNGEGGYSASGVRDGYPWAEAYYHDGQGNVSDIFQRPAVRGNPIDLYAMEANYPLSLRRALYYPGRLIAPRFARPDAWNDIIPE